MESDFDSSFVKPHFDQQIQNQESEDSGLTFDKNTSVTMNFKKTTELGGPSYVNVYKGSSATYKVENDDKRCLFFGRY